ncbi:MAG: hypothetical protein HY059_09330 [Proteobacteria bacterium]|nr:hypothetical protein [Pseudomonadota bacterium]
MPNRPVSLRIFQERMATVDARFDGIESRLAGVEAGLQRVALDGIKTREGMGHLEERLKGDMRRLEAVVAAKLDVFMTRMETLWRESATTPLVLDRHGATLRDHEPRLNRLEDKSKS